MSNKTKILFFASNPEDMTQLALDEEIRAIKTKISASSYRDNLDLDSIWAARPDDLLQELNENKPTVVHFSGHGSSSGELLLLDDLRQSRKVSPASLKALFSTLKDNIKLVVLNACYSKMQADAIAEVIDCVVGMNSEISDQASITFSASFYRAVGFGRSVKEAFEQGKVSLMLEGISEEEKIELLNRPSVNPSEIYLIQKRKIKADKKVDTGKKNESKKKDKDKDCELFLQLQPDISKLRDACQDSKTDNPMRELRKMIVERLKNLASTNEVSFNNLPPGDLLLELGEAKIINSEILESLEYALTVTSATLYDEKISKNDALNALCEAAFGFNIINNSTSNLSHFRIVNYPKSGQWSFMFLKGDQVLIHGEKYHSRPSAMNGIASVRSVVMRNKIREKTSKDNRFYFQLIAGNGQIVGISTLFQTEKARVHCIQLVKDHLPSAPIVIT